nr:hypothetical protein [Tanacetum cinerariifolium]
MAATVFNSPLGREHYGNDMMEGVKPSCRICGFVKTKTGHVLGIDLDRGDNTYTIKRRLPIALSFPVEESSLTFRDMRNQSGPTKILGNIVNFKNKKQLVKEILKAMKISVEPVDDEPFLTNNPKGFLEVCSQYHELVRQQSILGSGRSFSLQSPFNSRDELFAPCHILLSPETRIHTRIEPFDLEFLDSVDLVEPHNLSFIVVDREHDYLRRLNDGIIMLELVACNISSWFSENQEDDRDDLAEEANLCLQSYWDAGS